MPKVDQCAGRLDLPTRNMEGEFCCYFCYGSDPSRTSGDKIRCTRFSQWVDPKHQCRDGISRADKQFLDAMGISRYGLTNLLDTAKGGNHV